MLVRPGPQYTVALPDLYNMPVFDEVVHGAAVYELKEAVARWNFYVKGLK